MSLPWSREWPLTMLSVDAKLEVATIAVDRGADALEANDVTDEAGAKL